MNPNPFYGDLVRLSAENPDAMTKAFSRWGQDMDFQLPIDSKPPTLWSQKKIQEWVEKDLNKETPDAFFFSIRLREDDRLIGFVAIWAISWCHGEGFVSIGIGEAEYRGKGYGSKAMRLMLEFAFRELNLRRISLIVFEYNTRAIRSYEKVGFVMEGKLRGCMRRDKQRWDWYIMGMLRDEWEAKYGNEIITR